MPSKPTAGAVDEYIRTFPAEIQTRLNAVRDLIRAIAPRRPSRSARNPDID